MGCCAVNDDDGELLHTTLDSYFFIYKEFYVLTHCRLRFDVLSLQHTAFDIEGLCQPVNKSIHYMFDLRILHSVHETETQICRHEVPDEEKLWELEVLLIPLSTVVLNRMVTCKN